MGALLLIVVLGASAIAPALDPAHGPDAARAAQPTFDATASRLGRDLRRRMRGRSFHPGCPVPLRRLRQLDLPHWGFDREVHRGKLIVHRRHANDVLRAMKALYRERFPIRRMRRVDAYGGNDRRSMRADNTSAFNCREVAGRPGVWSQHAYGRAIDINPVENPYVSPGGSVSPRKGTRFADRSRRARGMIRGGDSTVRAFRRQGWEWGGKWSGAKDYQHFSSNGR